MGTWSDDIFGNDLAADVRDEYQERLNAGDSPEAALKHVRRSFADPMRDADDRRTVWIALAATQVAQSSIDVTVREQALKAIVWCEKPERDPESYPFELKALAQLRVKLGGEPPKPVKKQKARSTAGEGGEVFAVTLPTTGGEAVLYLAGPAGNDRGPDARRLVLLLDFEPDAVTEESVSAALAAWRQYYQVWSDGHVGRGIGCYDVKGKVPARRTRVLLRGVKMPPGFAQRMQDLGAVHQAALIPWVVERELEEWKTFKWVIDPKD